MRYSALIADAARRRKAFKAATSVAPIDPLSAILPAMFVPLLVAVFRGMQQGPTVERVPQAKPLPPVILEPWRVEGVLKKINELLPRTQEPQYVLERVKRELRDLGSFVEVLPSQELDRLARHFLLLALSWQRYLPRLQVGGRPEDPGAFVVARAETGKLVPRIRVSPEALQDPEQARRVLAHEVGHWVVWLSQVQLDKEEHEILADLFERWLMGDAPPEKVSREEMESLIDSYLRAANVDKEVVRGIWNVLHEIAREQAAP